MNTELRKKINKTFVVRVTDPFGEVKLIGGGQLHKYIGSNGQAIAEDLASKALEAKETKHTTELRGVKIVFHKK